MLAPIVHQRVPLTQPPFTEAVLAALPKGRLARLRDWVAARRDWRIAVMGSPSWEMADRFVRTRNGRWHRLDGDGKVGRALSRAISRMLDAALATE